MRVCQVENCSNKHEAKGFCAKHYQRLRLHGTYAGGGSTERGAVKDWLQEYANYTGDDCIEWPFSKSGKRGYGSAHFGGRTRTASNAMCEVAHGPAPTPWHEAAHSCGNGHLACVNPRHLRWATRSENQIDRSLHGNKGRRLLPETVFSIRQSLTKPGTQRDLASEYGVSLATINDIARKRTWAHLPDEIDEEMI